MRPNVSMMKLIALILLQGEVLRQILLKKYVGDEMRDQRSHKNQTNSHRIESHHHMIYGADTRRVSCQNNHHFGSGPGNVMLSRAKMTLAEVQCHLDRQGASNLVVELIIQNPNQNIFIMSVELGIALLEGGNTFIQQSMFNKLQISSNSERFFRVFYLKMTSAQQEIRSTVAVNTNELINGPAIVKGSAAASADVGDDRKIKGLIPYKRNGIILTEELKKQFAEAASATNRAFQFIKSLGTAISAKTCGRNTAAVVSLNLKNANGSPAILTTAIDETGRRSSVVSDDMKDDMTDSGSLTPVHKVSGDGIHSSHQKMFRHSNSVVGYSDSAEKERNKLATEVEIMGPILRFLQLLCENHNLELQNFLRHQNNKNNFNIVSETLLFLDCMCGSTTGGLGLLGLYINEKNVTLVNQTLETLTEYCQGPCHENQNCIAMHESNAIDIIIALILNDVNPLGKTRMDLVLSLKNNASKLLLAIMESRADSGNAERIMYNMSAKQLIDAAVNAFHQSISFMNNELGMDSKDFYTLELLSTSADGMLDDEEDDDEVTPKEVGHNIYILCHQLARHNKELTAYLKPNSLIDASLSPEINSKYTKALSYYRKHTAQIEIVRSDRTMEQIVFPVPQICEFLTTESKQKVFHTTERDEQGSKVSDFFLRTEDLYDEMKWQKKLRTQPLLYFVSSYMSVWATVSFNLALFLNIIVAIFYPFEKSASKTQDLEWSISILLWALTMIATAAFLKFRSRFMARTLIIPCIVRGIYTFGVETSLIILGIMNVASAAVHLISIMGNRGTFTKSILQILTDFEIIYHVIYLIFCILGLCFHPFFYSVLLLSVVYKEETLKNVIRSVTRNGRSIILTALLAVILIYLFSIIGYLFFRDDFVMEVNPKLSAAGIVEPDLNDNSTESSCQAGDGIANCSVPQSNNSALMSAISKENDGDGDDDDKERACDSLIMCIITTLNQGLRNGGGIGDVLRPPSSSEPFFVLRVIYDLLFFFVVIIIILNLIFGVIIDTFADLRSEKQQKEEILRNTCFICGLDRSAFDNKTTSFEDHIRYEHNMWHYLYFMVLTKVKNPTEFTGPESYVASMIAGRNLEWFPRMRAMSLDSKESSEESGSLNEMKCLQKDLEVTQRLVATLSQQLNELREQVNLSPFFFFFYKLIDVDAADDGTEETAAEKRHPVDDGRRCISRFQ